MLSARETQVVLEKHFNGCYKYWISQDYIDGERDAFKRALDDIRYMKYDPFSPCGEELDPETKKKVIHYRERDVGVN